MAIEMFFSGDIQPSAMRSALKYIIASTYFILCGLAPVLYVVSAYENGYVYIQLYSHFYLYPLYFGWITVILLLNSWESLGRKLTRDQKLICFLGLLAFALMATMIDVSSDNVAPFQVKPSILEAELVLNDHFVNRPTSADRFEYQERINQIVKNIGYTSWSMSHYLYLLSFLCQAYFYGLTIVTSFVMVAYRFRDDFTSTAEFRNALINLSVAFLVSILWFLMRSAFRQEKLLFFPAESLPTGDYLLILGYGMCAVLIALCFWLWLGDKLIAFASLIFGVVSALTIWKEQEILVDLFGREAGQMSYLCILFGMSFLWFLWRLAYGAYKRPSRRTGD